MVTKNNSTVTEKSSEMLAEFLEKNNLHKKDFAQMVGVTLSYVYNLIDETIPFSTRSTTLERIATVMDILPEDFAEYKISQDPVLPEPATEFIKSQIKKNKLTTVQFLKSFPRKQRLEIVDILRGARPLPVDWEAIKMMGEILNVSKEEMYNLWETRMRQLLATSGFNPENNSELTEVIFDCAKKHINKVKK